MVMLGELMLRLLVSAFLLVSVGHCSSVSVKENIPDWQEQGIADNLDTFRAIVAKLEAGEEYKTEKARHCDNEGNFIIDYSRMQVSDWKAPANLHYSQAFDEIRRLFRMIEQQPIIMNFSGNYLTDDGVNALVDFILANPKLKDRLKSLDLSNNRFRYSALDKLLNLVENCPSLERLNLSVNYFGFEELKRAGLNTEKVYFVPY
jgi:hypothetical protein